MIGDTFELKLKKNYVKALSQGYVLALKTILESLQSDSSFNVIEYCEKELDLMNDGRMEKVLDNIYDKKDLSKEKRGN